MILDLAMNDSAAPAKVLGALPRRDSDDNLICELSLSCELTTIEDAAALAAFAPGAVLLFKAGESSRRSAALRTATDGAAAGAAQARAEGTFGDLTVKLPQAMRKVSITVAFDGDEYPLGAAELIGALRFKSTPKTAAAVYKFRIEDIEGAEVGALAEMINRVADVTIARKQTVLDFPKRAAEVAPEVGQIVSGIEDGTEYAGIVMGFSEDDDKVQMMEVDDCGDVKLVRVASVSGALTVKGDGQALEDALAGYLSAAEGAGTAPTWRSLVVALGQRYLAEGKDDSEWVLDADVIEAAVAVSAA